MENNALWDQWNTFGGNAPQAPDVAGLTCPSNPPEAKGQPWLNYVGNAGWAFTDSGTNGRSGDTSEHAANGIFFDLNKNTNISPVDGREGQPALQMSMSQILDGTTKTMMLSESMHTFYWTFGPPDGGGLNADNASIKDTKHLFGFIWKNSPGPNERINGDKFYDATSPGPPADMAAFSDPTKYESYAYPSSVHPGGVNIAFCAGQVEFIRESIDPGVYGQLMTSNAKRSNLYVNGVADRKANPPSEDQYH
jgi:hypothetical protein